MSNKKAFKKKLKEAVKKSPIKKHEKEAKDSPKITLKERIKNLPKTIKGLYNMDTKRGRKVSLLTVLVIGMALGVWKQQYTDSQSISGSVATYKNGRITTSQFYKFLKNNQNGSGVLRNTIGFDIAGSLYGDKISKEEVTQTYNEMTSSNSLQYLSSITNDQSSEKKQKELVKQYLAFNYGLMESVSVSDSELKEAWNNYVPDAKVKVITVSDKATADSIKTELDAISSASDRATRFQELAKEHSEDSNEGKTVTISQTNSTFGSDTTNQVLGMAQDEVLVSQVQAVDSSTSESSVKYLVFMMIDKGSKGSFSDHKKELTAQVRQSKIASDTKITTNYLKKLFKEGNVKVSDEYMKTAFEDYTK